MRRLTLTALFLTALCAPQQVRGEEPKPPPELQVLQTIGTWDEVMTNKPSEWLPTAGQSTTVTKKTWFLGDKFVRMEGVLQPSKTEFFSLLTYDPDVKVYRTWYFDSGGAMPRGMVQGTWDEKTRTITWTGTDEAGNKTTGKSKFTDKDNHEWTLVVKSPDGKLLLDMSGKCTRRKE
jgi:hypothetical protein